MTQGDGVGGSFEMTQQLRPGGSKKDTGDKKVLDTLLPVAV